MTVQSQAMEAAIELNLNTVEAGAQGEHKIQRGYLPVTTYSLHYLLDEGFKKAIEDFVLREATQVPELYTRYHFAGEALLDLSTLKFNSISPTNVC